MKQTFIYGAMATGLLFTACTAEDPGNENQVAEADKTLYVQMAIRGDMGGTRAAGANGSPDAEGDFDPGTDESTVQNAYFVFYDDAGQMVGDIVSVNLASMTPTEGTNGTSVEKYYKSVVPVGVRKGQGNPTQVLCYINPITPAALQNPLSVIQTVTRQNVVTGDETQKYFPMSNSVYYTSTDANAEPQLATPITAGSLYDTEAEALAAPEGNIIDVYVERYAAKLSFNATNAAPYATHTAVVSPNGTTSETPVTLNFVAQRWALNAEATSTYVLKSFRQTGTAGTILADNYPYSMLNERINANKFSFSNPDVTIEGTLGQTDAWAWNNSALHRSYWAVSPAYFTAVYPEVASDVTNPDLQLNQKYYTYAELTNPTNPAGFAGNNTAAQYFRETTVGIPALSSANPAAATPSVILVGHYTLSVNGTDAGRIGFYTYLNGSDGKPLVYFETTGNAAASAVTGGDSMLKRFLTQATVLYKREGDAYVRFNTTNASDLQRLAAVLQVAAPSDEVKGNLKIAARHRTLQFIADANTEGIYIANGNGYRAIGTEDGQITLTDANKVLMQQVGFANYYTNGDAYFNIPVKHYGWYRQGNTQKNETKIDWSKVRVGDFGLVRNHAYNINVTEITGLATGIGGENDPIVPPSETKDYYVAYRVNILKWAVVPTQNVVIQ